MSDDVCGSTDTCSGEPCQFSPGESCPYHDTDDPPDAGRPSKFTEDRAQDAIEAAREGKSKAGCARAAGIGKATLERWLEAEEYGYDGELFRNAFARARARGETRVLEGGLYGDADPSMAKFLLASSFDYIKTERREHEGDMDVSGDLVIDFEESDT